MKKIYLLIVLSCIAFAGNAQTATDYLFTATTGTYTSISGTAGVSSSTITCDDCTQTNIPIGFTFKFCGTSYTQLSACSNGWISLANSSYSGYQNMSSFIPGAGFLMLFWGDLFGSGHNAYYVTTGTSPNRVFTFEWNNFSSMSGSVNMQVKLYETTNTVEFLYGTSTTGSGMYTVGIANSSSNWQTLPNTGSSPTPSSSTFTNVLPSTPASGQIYRWQAKCIGFGTTATINATVPSGCATFSSSLSLSDVPADVVGLTYQWKTAPTSTGPWTNVAGATNNTYAATVAANIYYTCQIQCSYSSIMQSIIDLPLTVNDPASITGPDTTCIGSTTTLADATPGGTWSSSNTSVAVVSSGGVVAGVTIGPVTITYSNLGCNAIKNIYVNTVPSAGTISGSYYVCPLPIPFTETVAGGVWGVTNPSIAGVSTTGSVFAIAPGLTTVTYSVTNGCGTSTASFPINTTPCLNEVAPIAHTNGLKLELTPNPNSGIFNLNILSATNEPAYLSISDLLGKEVKRVTAFTNKTETLSTDLPSGVYIISVTTAQGKDVAKLIID